MRNVLADLELEHEGALALAMRVARALDRRDDAHEDAPVRLVTPAGKYWICKRTPGHAYEAMACIGGSGVMEDGPHRNYGGLPRGVDCSALITRATPQA